jgi:hypothetical protein
MDRTLLGLIIIRIVIALALLNRRPRSDTEMERGDVELTSNKPPLSLIGRTHTVGILSVRPTC